MARTRSHFAIDERGASSPSTRTPRRTLIARGDADGDNVYHVTIQARDDQFNTASLPVTVTVTDGK